LRQELHEFDVCVLGSGAAGLAAAFSAAQGGCKVLVIEKAPVFGGSTAISGGVVWIPCNAEMKDVGIDDSPDAARAYLRNVLGNRYREDLVESFLAHGPEMVDFMHRHSELRLVPRALAPDYYPDLEGAALGGRAMDPQVYDGRRLGKWFRKVRFPLREFMVFNGLMVGRAEIDHLLGTFRTPQDFAKSVGLVAGFLRDRLRYGRGTRVLMGNALVAQLMKSALDAGVEFWNATETLEIQRHDGRADTLKVRRNDQEATVRARTGIVLATGGAAANAQMMAPDLKTPDMHLTMAPKENTGEMIRLALKLGAVLDDNVEDAANYAPVSQHVTPEGQKIRFPHLFMDRPKPGLIAVGRNGRRFTNEASSYHAFVQGMLNAPDAVALPAHLVCDAAFLRRYGMGLVRPGLQPRAKYIASGYLKSADTIADLAARIGVSPAALVDEVEKHNRFAAAGEDPDFGKGSNAYDRAQGDAGHRPNPCLGPIAKAPFFSITVHPGDIGPTRGLVTDRAARVLDQDGAVISGLYACGNDMNSVMAGTYPAAGITLGPALTFGYLIGRELAGRLTAV
jgi:succinate dehydrogenase/fumarate reductase flavoprotein subunit